MALTGVVGGVTVAQAAINDACTVTVTNDGILDATGTCIETATLSSGDSCGSDGGKDYFYSTTGDQCVADGAVGPNCSAGIYFAGVCSTPPTPTPPTAPTPAGFTGVAGAGDNPGGGQPMCVNASPFLGGGFGIVSGTVLCYTGAGKLTDIQAYTDTGSSPGGVGPVSFDYWNSISLRDLFASDDLTALGTLSVFDGAQIYSSNGYNGMQITDDGILMRAGNATNTNEVSTFELTDEQVKLLSTDGTSSAGLEVNFQEGASLTAYLFGSDGPAVTIDGRLDNTSTGAQGVLITGSGQGNRTAPLDGDANWADVQVSSANYGTLFGEANGLGTAVIVNDYGMKLKAPELRSGGTSSNEFVSGANNEAGSTLLNSFGAGGAGNVINTIGAGSSGSVINDIGAGSSGTVTNNIGAGSSGTVTNNMGAGSSGSVANNIGAGSTGDVVNTIGAGSSGSVINDIGAGSTGSMLNALGTAGNSGSVVYNIIGTDDGLKGGTTINRIGNVNDLTEVRATAATSSMVMIKGALDMASIDGQSVLSGPVYAVNSGSSLIQKDASGKHLVSDANGRLTVVDGVADEATNSVYLRNGYGDTNGLILTETGATLTGGTTGGTAMALSDQGVHFSHSGTGAPVRMSGIADGEDPFDAINERQLNGSIASVAALAGLPAPQLGKRNSFGMGFGVHDGGRALALGGQSMFLDGMTFKYGVAVSESAGLYDSTASLGVGFSW